jgi:DNA modification methylase
MFNIENIKNNILQGDSLEVLKQVPDESIDCVITSPPYWGLRDYGHDGQIGLEKTPEEFVEKLVAIFREVRRVLRADGTCWVNLGDSYYGGGWKGSITDLSGTKQGTNIGTLCGKDLTPDPKHPIIKPKDLVGIPWRVAFALQADGWYLRQDIIWHKPNPMPESVTDRCTKAHEYIFLLSKSAKYYYDNEAIKEDFADDRMGNPGKYSWKYANGGRSTVGAVDSLAKNGMEWNVDGDISGRNKRSVWTVSVKPFNESHFATFPQDLIKPCVLAGCPENGIILDPFMGAGTTGLVAYKNNRNYIGVELNPAYIQIAEKRIQQEKDKLALFNGLEAS